VIVGRVDESGVATLDLIVANLKRGDVVVTCMIDTGFDGLLTLPPEVIASLKLEERGQAVAILADGTKSMLSYYAAEVQWHDRPLSMDVLAADNLPLVGMNLLHGSFIGIEVVEGGRVEIRELP
jgi:clan AA aspartic protease